MFSRGFAMPSLQKLWPKSWRSEEKAIGPEWSCLREANVVFEVKRANIRLNNLCTTVVLSLV